MRELGWFYQRIVILRRFFFRPDQITSFGLENITFKLKKLKFWETGFFRSFEVIEINKANSTLFKVYGYSGGYGRYWRPNNSITKKYMIN